MKDTRDKCWLEKQVFDSTIKTFSIKKNGSISKTIIDEMPKLFKGIEYCKEAGSITFEKIEDENLGQEGFKICKEGCRFFIYGFTEKSLLYGMFELYRKLLDVKEIKKFNNITCLPNQNYRMINHWDNIDGSIERGYAGDSIFYKDNGFREDFHIIKEYARLLSSVGINSISINNVNVHRKEVELILEKNLSNIKKINDIFSSYGIKTFLSINFASPKIIGGLDTADPLDENVRLFWNKIIENIYLKIPDFGGFVVKADSEGEPGPFAYGRGHDDGANMFGELFSRFGGVCIWRCFVYNSTQDWRDRTTDRSRAAYDHFMPLDGKFRKNVILQIKLGPLDFQVKEPVSPLFGGLRKTNQIIEFQLTQEYTGQQKAIYYQVPVWKEALDFDTQYDYKPSIVKELLKTNSMISTNSGICAVGVVGMNSNWTGHKLMQVNLYAYGRLCWNNSLSSELIADEWINATFNLPEDKKTLMKNILVTSRSTYQKYNAPNGVGFMCRPNHHYGPDIDGYEYDRWGTYHFADRDRIGVNRTTSGTKFVEQYSKKICDFYNNISTCPDDLLLWFHHVNYTHVLHSGKTLIQDIYDNHFEGVQMVEKYMHEWDGFQGFLTFEDFDNVKKLIEEQYRLSIEWRDQVNTYFYRKSGIKDEKDRRIYA